MNDMNSTDFLEELGGKLSKDSTIEERQTFLDYVEVACMGIAKISIDGASEDGGGATGTIEDQLLADGFNPNLKDASPEAIVEMGGKLKKRLQNEPDPTIRFLLEETATKWLKSYSSAPKKLIKTMLPEPSSDSSAEESQGLTFEDIKPCSDPVDGNNLLDQLTKTFKDHMVLPSGMPELCAVYSLFTHCIDAFDYAPYLSVSSATMRSGKSRLGDIFEALVQKPLKADSATEATIFRVVNAHEPTMILDEADTWSRDNEGMRGILNAGNKRNAKVLRCSGDSHEPKAYKVFGAKIILGIGKRWGTLADRCIEIALKRKLVSEEVQRIKASRFHKDLKPIREQMRRWANDHMDDLRDAEPELPQLTDDRAMDNWEPLLAIGDACSKQWGERLREIAQETHKEKEENEIIVRLVHDMEKIFEDHYSDKMTSEQMCNELAQIDDAPWGSWGRMGPITKISLAKKLKPFGIKPDQFWESDKKKRGYKREDLKDTLARYPLPTESVDSVEPSNDKEKSDNSSRYESPNLPSSKSPNNVDKQTNLPPLPSEPSSAVQQDTLALGDEDIIQTKKAMKRKNQFDAISR